MAGIIPPPSNARPLKPHPRKTGTHTTKWSPSAQEARPAGQSLYCDPGPFALKLKIGR